MTVREQIGQMIDAISIGWLGGLFYIFMVILFFWLIVRKRGK